MRVKEIEMNAALITPYSKEDLEFFEVMDGMNEVNCEMAEKMEKENPAPICHFTTMQHDDGMFYCRHCSHSKEDPLYIEDGYYCY